jgi:hypothetical protein
LRLFTNALESVEMNEETPQPKPETLTSALAHGAFTRDPRESAAAIVTGHDPNLTVKDGAEAAVARFCEQAFVTPESAKAGSAALLQAFDDSGLWLANLVHPHQLVAELRQSESTLSRVIITQWTRQGETHKLVRLGTALIEASPPVTTHEAGQIGALLASLLGVLRPPKAQDLLEFARPLLKDSVDPHLLREARAWVDIGRILEAAPAEDRFFWNRRLREPEDEWDWDTAEARAALRRLSPILSALGDSTDLSRFQQTVPPCWWDLLRDTPHNAPDRPRLTAIQESAEAQRSQPSAPAYAGYFPPPAAAPAPRFGIYAFGLVTGLACMGLVAWLNSTQRNPSTSTAVVPPAVATPAAIAAVPPQASGTPAPASTTFAPALRERAEPSSPPKAAAVPRPTTPQSLRRDAAVAELAQKFPHLQRLHRLAITGTLRENEDLLKGYSTLSRDDYQALMRWLMLDPPEFAEVRLAVAKVAARVIPAKELLPLLTLCIYPTSSNASEARQCATWALELNASELNASDRQSFESLRSSLAQNAN